jgi:hypothetical protein
MDSKAGFESLLEFCDGAAEFGQRILGKRGHAFNPFAPVKI